ncbi:hypothetical protein GCM10009119_40270 [Algoriphagus jejuensis]|uniref:Uncharacterized protein n=1 Tax=Algoriphagus jejuensis TaxID=419934 RepID=A0ABP3YLU3_9BACT
MDDSIRPLDLNLWLDVDLIRQQNFLKSQFISILEAVANSVPLRDLEGISPRVRSSKISKGNDLLGLPYQVLDVVRDFDSVDGVNIRLLNWFGNGFFVSILMGKNRKNPILQLLQQGFSFGLSENKWDYPDLILNKNLSDDPKIIQRSDLDFHLWIKSVEIEKDPKATVASLCREVKKILSMLELPSEQSRN